jgi:hypothetical protein
VSAVCLFRACGRSCAYGQILLVGEDQEESIAQLVLVQHALELLTRLNNTVAIVAVNDEDDTLGVLEVMPPERTDLVLTADIPHGERDVLVLDGLDVETCHVGQRTAHGCEGAGRNEPIVGMVVTISPSLSLYRIVVFPAASKPTMRMRISFLPHSLSNSFENVRPMFAVGCVCGVWEGGKCERQSRTWAHS